MSDDESSRPDLPPGATSNKIEAGTARTVFQAGRIGGDFVFNGVPGVEAQPGLVSIAPPFDRLTGKLHGRENVVAHLLGTARRSGGAVVVLHGRGGCGKTSVALETARRLGRGEPVVRTWWVDAGSAAGLEAGLREVAFDAGACPSDIARAWSGESSAVELLGRVLGAARWPWLLI
ncbi:MAG TPA: ATP-binding protein, partial [Lentzea sp.]